MSKNNAIQHITDLSETEQKQFAELEAQGIYPILMEISSPQLGTHYKFVYEKDDKGNICGVSTSKEDQLNNHNKKNPKKLLVCFNNNQ